MAKISDEIKHFLERQKLGFVATISPDNTPNVSPKGTILAWDDEHLIFADIRSPQTISNLENNSSVVWVAIIGGGIGYFFLYGELVNLMR